MVFELKATREKSASGALVNRACAALVVLLPISNFAVGLLVPIPTLPLESIRIRSPLL